MGVATGESHHVTSDRIQCYQDFSVYYKFGAVLGTGRCGEVKACVCTDSGKQCAVKVLDKCDPKSSIDHAADEIEILRDTFHPNIVTLFEHFEYNNHIYMVMELVSGGDLCRYIIKHGHFTEEEAREPFREVCEGVGYLHQLNIVHCDLKPDNILVSSSHNRASLHPKICDFGIARKSYSPEDCTTYCGTAGYVSPEVLKLKDADVGGTSSSGWGRPVDLWSLGVLLYIMLSGVPPFWLDHQIREGRYKFDVHAWQLVSQKGKDVVACFLKVDPFKRPLIAQVLAFTWLEDPSPNLQEPQRSNSKDVDHTAHTTPCSQEVVPATKTLDIYCDAWQGAVGGS